MGCRSLIEIDAEDVGRLKKWLTKDEGIQPLSVRLAPMLDENSETIRTRLNKWLSSKKVNPEELVKIKKALGRELPMFISTDLNERLQQPPERFINKAMLGKWHLYLYRLREEQQAKEPPQIERHTLQVLSDTAEVKGQDQQLSWRFSGHCMREHDCHILSLEDDNHTDKMTYIITGANDENGGWLVGQLLSISGGGLLRTRYFVGSKNKLNDQEADSALQAAGNIFEYNKRFGAFYVSRDQLGKMRSIFDAAKKNASPDSDQVEDDRE